MAGGLFFPLDVWFLCFFCVWLLEFIGGSLEHFSFPSGEDRVEVEGYDLPYFLATQ
ncbi:hypothetical protein Bca4012_083266 [Brassica carinata]